MLQCALENRIPLQTDDPLPFLDDHLKEIIGESHPKQVIIENIVLII